MAMVNASGNLWVDNTIIAAITESQQEQAERRRPRRFLDRVPLVDADDEEIIAIWTASRFAADLIAPNQPARTVAAGSLEFNVAELPNIKLGAHLNQQDINRMERLQMRQQAGVAGEEAVFLFWEDIVRERREGVLDRLNQLACAMLIGNLNYGRLGVEISSNFLMPSDLRIAPTTLWTSTSATPINDVLAAQQYTQLTYGWIPDRLTLARQDWINLLATTQWSQLAQMFTKVAAPNATNTAYWPQMMTFFQQETGMMIELEDWGYRTEETDGTVNFHRVMPQGTALLTSSQDDGDKRMFDIGNAPLTEASVARLVGLNVDLGGQERGPAVFATAPAEMNPPQITVWGCARAFPRRKQKCCSAVLLVA